MAGCRRQRLHILRRMCESGGMAQTVNVIVAAEDRERLLAIAGDRDRPLKHVQRARGAFAGRRTGVSRPAVWRWQRRYGEEGIDSLLRDKTRKPGRAPLSTGVVAKVLALACSEPAGGNQHWTGRAMAKAVGISLRAVQRLWEANRLQPHRLSHLQALQRTEIRREGRGRRRSLHGPASSRRGRLHRREEPNSSSRS